MLLDNLGEIIRSSRIKKGMTQSELANELHVTDKAISNWENNRRLPDYSSFFSILNILDIDLLKDIMKDDSKDKYIEFLLNTVNNYERKEYDQYNRLEVIIKINNEFKYAYLMLDNKRIVTTEDDETIIHQYNNIKNLVPYIEIGKSINEIGDFDNILPLEIFESSYKTGKYNSYDYNDYKKEPIKAMLYQYYGNIDDIYNPLIDKFLTEFINDEYYSERDFGEYILRCINDLHKEDINKVLKEFFILQSIFNPDYMEMFYKIYNYIK